MAVLDDDAVTKMMLELSAITVPTMMPSVMMTTVLDNYGPSACPRCQRRKSDTNAGESGETIRYFACMLRLRRRNSESHAKVPAFGGELAKNRSKR